MDSYVTTDKKWLVTLGHAPLPSHVLTPKTLRPMSSAKRLMEYIGTHKQGCCQGDSLSRSGGCSTCHGCFHCTESQHVLQEAGEEVGGWVGQAGGV